MSVRLFLNLSLGLLTGLFLATFVLIHQGQRAENLTTRQIELAQRQQVLVEELTAGVQALPKAETPEARDQLAKEIGQSAGLFDLTLMALTKGGKTIDAAGFQVTVPPVKDDRAREELAGTYGIWARVSCPLLDLTSGTFDPEKSGGLEAVQLILNKQETLAEHLARTTEALQRSAAGDAAGQPIFLWIIAVSFLAVAGLSFAFLHLESLPSLAVWLGKVQDRVTARRQAELPAQEDTAEAADSPPEAEATAGEATEPGDEDESAPAGDAEPVHDEKAPPVDPTPIIEEMHGEIGELKESLHALAMSVTDITGQVAALASARAASAEVAVADEPAGQVAEPPAAPSEPETEDFPVEPEAEADFEEPEAEEAPAEPTTEAEDFLAELEAEADQAVAEVEEEPEPPVTEAEPAQPEPEAPEVENEPTEPAAEAPAPEPAEAAPAEPTSSTKVFTLKRPKGRPAREDDALAKPPSPAREASVTESVEPEAPDPEAIDAGQEPPPDAAPAEEEASRVFTLDPTESETEPAHEQDEVENEGESEGEPEKETSSSVFMIQK